MKRDTSFNAVVDIDEEYQILETGIITDALTANAHAPPTQIMPKNRIRLNIYCVIKLIAI